MQKKLLWVALLVAVVALVACVPLTPPAPSVTPAPEEEATAIVPSDGESTNTSPDIVSPDIAMEEVVLSGVLTGSVTYRQRIALPAGSVIEVSLQDVSRQDVAATIIATQTITTAGENVPIPFELVYDPAEIDPRMSYAVSVRITQDGQLRWINTERFAVLTHDAPVTGVEVVVQSVQ